MLVVDNRFVDRTRLDWNIRVGWPVAPEGRAQCTLRTMKTLLAESISAGSFVLSAKAYLIVIELIRF